MNNKISIAVKIGIFGCVLVTSSAAFATHGMLTASRSIRSAGMGGASVAVTSGTVSATEVNPANIAFATRDSVIFDMSAMIPSVTGKDSAQRGGISHDSDSAAFPMPSFSYVHHAVDSNWAFGLGMEALGGMGASYDELSGMGKGKHSSKVGYATLNFLVAYKLSDNWAISAAPFLSYSTMEMDTPMMEASDMTTTGYGLKLGTTYKINDVWNVGASFTTEDSLDYKGDIESKGPHGSKQSGSASMAWPAEVTVGTAYQATNKLLVAFDVSWIGWKSAMDKMSMQSGALVDPKRNPSGSMDMNLDWNDQLTYALGLEYALTKKVTLRTGYSYGKNPVPSDTVMPLFPAIVEHHLSAGLGYAVTENFVLNGAVEYAFSNSQKNTYQRTGPQDPNGSFAGSESTLSIWTVGIGGSYLF